MAAPIIFEKNKIDIDVANVTMTVTDAVATDNGQDFIDLVRNRKNDSGFATTDSTDAALTTIDIETADAHEITDFLLVDHNLKSYTFQYWDDNTLAFTNFSTPINETNNSTTTKRHSFTAVSFWKSRLVINGTMTVDDDKFIAQIILTKLMGQFTAQPFIKKPKLSKNRKMKQMISGRTNITRAPGAFSWLLSFPPSKTSNDTSLAVAMMDSFDGFLVWLCGGSVAQFPVEMPGFRLKDIPLMQCTNELDVEWKDGRFDHGQTLELQLAESRT